MEKIGRVKKESENGGERNDRIKLKEYGFWETKTDVSFLLITFHSLYSCSHASTTEG